MAKLSIVNVLDQRKSLSHIIIISISITTVLLFSLTTEINNSLSDKWRFFLMLLIQLEAFIFIASKIFTEISVGLSRKDFTRIIISRFIIFFIVCFCAAFVIFLAFRYVIALSENRDLTSVWGNIVKYEIANWVKSTLKGLSLGAIIFVIIQWQDALKREQKLREENLIFQNETLKNQINPHFLFNSLNTLSSLISARPEDAEKFINKLSTIYRYILENSRKDRVSLQSELDFISDYFELHKVRDQEKIALKIDSPGASEFDIIPVSLQILIENAIKHNMATKEYPLVISIAIEDRYVVVKNNIQKMGMQIKSTKIGLKNLDERVKLVTKKDLIVEETNDLFIVKVPLLK